MWFDEENNYHRTDYTMDDFFPEYSNVDMNKPIVYIIMCGDDCAFEGGGTIDKIFKDPEVALKYCNRQNELEKDSSYYFYPEAQNYSDDEVDTKSPIVEYYSYLCDLKCDNPEEAYINYPDEKTTKIYKGDLYIDADNYDTCYTVYSINSFEEAKDKALQIWKNGFKLDDTHWDGFGKVCPICGGKIIHPYTGEVTSEQLDEESNCCIWMECIDEGRSTTGYVPCCRKENK